jgi:hypothetical protein
MYFIYNKLKRKPWSKSKAKKVFYLREDCITNSSNFKLLNNRVVELKEALKILGDNINAMKRQRAMILSRLPEDENKLIEDITISNLYDSYNFNRYNFVARPQFTDLINANDLKKEIAEKEEKKAKFDDLLKELEINLIQNKIDSLLGLLEDEYEI